MNKNSDKPENGPPNRGHSSAIEDEAALFLSSNSQRASRFSHKYFMRSPRSTRTEHGSFFFFLLGDNRKSSLLTFLPARAHLRKQRKCRRYLFSFPALLLHQGILMVCSRTMCLFSHLNLDEGFCFLQSQPKKKTVLYGNLFFLFYSSIVAKVRYIKKRLLLDCRLRCTNYRSQSTKDCIASALPASFSKNKNSVTLNNFSKQKKKKSLKRYRTFRFF